MITVIERINCRKPTLWFRKSGNSVDLSLTLFKTVWIFFWILQKSHQSIWFKMESLKLFRKHLVMCGIRPQKCRYNAKNSSVLIVIGIVVLSYVKQLNETQTFEQYAYIVYSTVSAFFFSGFYLSVIYKTTELFKLTDDIDKIVYNSK